MINPNNEIGIMSGNLIICDMEYIKKNGGKFGEDAKKNCKLHSLPKGSYNVIYSCKNKQGIKPGERKISVPSGKLLVGDICHFFSSKDVKQKVWTKFLKKIDYFKKSSSKYVFIHTGGEANINLKLELEKI